MVLEWGMSDRLGFVRYAYDDTNESPFAEKEYSPETGRIIDEEVKLIIDTAYADTEKMVTEHWGIVTNVAEALLRYETLQSQEVATLIAGGTIDRPTVADLLDAEAGSPPPPSIELEEEADPIVPKEDEGDGLLPAPA
jgi:cell division protease FtsH